MHGSFPRECIDTLIEQVVLYRHRVQGSRLPEVPSQAPYYIFVSPHEKRLAERIEQGLEMMIEDGSHKALFDKYYAAKIVAADLPSRHIIRIENTKLSPETPLNRKELWFEYDMPH